MGITESYLTILLDGLDKKIDILNNLIQLNDKQTSLISEDKFNDEAFFELAQKKEEFINALNKLDEGFQSIYNKVKSELQDGRSKYATEITEIQMRITKVMELSNHVQAKEKRNYESITNKLKGLRKEAKIAKQNQKTVTNYYKKMNYASLEPQFMDQKK